MDRVLVVEAVDIRWCAIHLAAHHVVKTVTTVTRSEWRDARLLHFTVKRCTTGHAAHQRQSVISAQTRQSLKPASELLLLSSWMRQIALTCRWSSDDCAIVSRQFVAVLVTFTLSNTGTRLATRGLTTDPLMDADPHSSSADCRWRERGLTANPKSSVRFKNVSSFAFSLYAWPMSWYRV